MQVKKGKRKKRNKKERERGERKKKEGREKITEKNHHLHWQYDNLVALDHVCLIH